MLRADRVAKLSKILKERQAREGYKLATPLPLEWSIAALHQSCVEMAERNRKLADEESVLHGRPGEVGVIESIHRTRAFTLEGMAGFLMDALHDAARVDDRERQASKGPARVPPR